MNPRKSFVVALAILFLTSFFSPSLTFARGGGHGGGHRSSGSHSGSHPSGKHSSKSYSSSGKKHGSKKAQGVKRDAHGKIARNEKAKKDFMKQSGYPNGRPGYVVDHIVPLKKGGSDTPSNMQWQTKDAAKEKDKWE